MRFLFAALLVFLSGDSLTERVLLDGVGGTLLAWLSAEDTELAPRYSDTAFLLIQPGMSRALVHRVLGPPLDGYPGNGYRGADLCERWARSPSGSSYRSRFVCYRDSRVVVRHSRFYLD